MKGGLSSSPPSIVGRGKESHTLVIAVGVGLLAFGVYLWQLSVPEFIQFYDTGVYLAASIHFVSGTLPYRDFFFAQPPGICLLLSPVGLISRVWGSHDGFIVARVLSALVTALNASLVSLLVRHRGRVAMLVAGVGLALLPVTFFVSSGVKLDPYCVCFALLGSLWIFAREERRGRLSGGDLAVGGALFGLAALVKLWAVFPFVALVICLVPRYRRDVLKLAGAAGAVFTALCLPFFVSAPGRFLSDVFVEQLSRRALPRDGRSIVTRLIFMTGFTSTSVQPTAEEAVLAFVLLACVVAVAYRRRVDHATSDYFLLLGAVLSVAAILAAPESFSYYGYFTAPFLLGVVAVCVGRLGPVARRAVARVKLTRPVRRLVAAAGAAAGAVLVVALVLYATTFYTNYAWGAGYWGPRLDVIDKVVPRGSCVVYDQVSYGVFANRLQSSDPRCPSVVDPLGMWFAWGYGLVAPPAAFSAEWKSYFEAAQYAVLSQPYPSSIPWDAGLKKWFARHYRFVASDAYVLVYKRVGTP